MNKNVFVVGAAKAGTTFISQILAASDDISSPKLKEPHFFAEDFPFASIEGHVPVARSLSEYESLYDRKASLYRGDYSTSYLWSKNAADNIHRYNDLSKIIILLREPKSRAYSHYLNNYGEGVDDRSFSVAIADEISGEFGHGYISYGQYYDQVKRYYDVFGKEAILLFWDKDLFKLDPNELILILAGFLGVEPWKLPIGIDKNEKRIAKHWVIRRMLGLSKLRVVVRALLPKKLQGLLKSQMYRKRLTVEEEADRDKGMSMLDGVFDEDLNKLERFLNEI